MARRRRAARQRGHGLLAADAGKPGYHWWSLPGAPFADGLHAGACLAVVAFGRRIYLNPAEQLVVVIQKALRRQSDPEAEAETVAFIRSMVVRVLQS